MKKILGELYGDRQYLQRLQTNLPGGRAEQDLAELTDEGLQFLRDRSIFWDTLGPLPPPHPPRRGRGRERTFAGTGAEGVQDLPWKRRKKDQMALQRDVTQVDFQFRSHLTTRQRNRRGVEETREQSRRPPGVTEGADRGQWETGEGGGGGGGGGGGKRAGHVTLVGFDDLESDRRRQLTGFLNEELDDIDEAFREKRYEDCLHQARVVLHAVTSLPEDDVRRQAETVASLHSCIGNASIALERYDQALYHHQMALNIGEERKNNIIVARSLGHVGRMYIIQRKFSNALEVFARKAPMCSSLEDVTQTFQEIGNCFLVLGHYDYARDCGKKSLQAATQANLPFFQQQAWILIAIAEAKLQNLKEAYKAFTGAFQVARKKGDRDSQDAIRGAMDHVNRKINRLLRKKSLVNQRMLLRKAKTLTQDDLSPSKPPAARHVRHRKQPISKQKKGEVMADTGSREQSRDRPRYRTHVTAQGVGVVPASDDDDDDDDYDDDFHSDAEDDFHYARDERPRPAMNDVTTSTERTAGGGKPSVNENDDEEPITFSLPCHLLSNDDDDDDDDDLLHTNRSQWEGEPPQTRDKRLVQTERSNRGNQATTRTEKRHGDRTSERLIQTERVERDEERRRFRREATVGSVNVDNNSYQQFARDASFNRASTLRAHQIYGTGRQSVVSRQSVWSRQSRHSLTTGHDSIVSRLTTKQERGGPTLDKPESQHGGSVLKRGESQHGGGVLKRGESQHGGDVLKGGESQHGGGVLKGGESQHGGNVLKGGESQHGGNVLKGRESQHGGNVLKGRESQHGGSVLKGGESQHGGSVLKGRESQHGGSAPKVRKSEDGRSQPDVLRNVEPLPPITAQQTVTGRQQRREHRDLTGGLFQTTLSPRQEQTVSPEQKYIAASILDQRSPASQKQTGTLRNKKHEETKKVKKSEDEDDALYQAESVNTETERDQQGNDEVQYTSEEKHGEEKQEEGRVLNLKHSQQSEYDDSMFDQSPLTYKLHHQQGRLDDRQDLDDGDDANTQQLTEQLDSYPHQPQNGDRKDNLRPLTREQDVNVETSTNTEFQSEVADVDNAQQLDAAEQESNTTHQAEVTEITEDNQRTYNTETEENTIQETNSADDQVEDTQQIPVPEHQNNLTERQDFADHEAKSSEESDVPEHRDPGAEQTEEETGATEQPGMGDHHSKGRQSHVDGNTPGVSGQSSTPDSPTGKTGGCHNDTAHTAPEISDGPGGQDNTTDVHGSSFLDGPATTNRASNMQGTHSTDGAKTEPHSGQQTADPPAGCSGTPEDSTQDGVTELRVRSGGRLSNTTTTVLPVTSQNLIGDESADRDVGEELTIDVISGTESVQHPVDAGEEPRHSSQPLTDGDNTQPRAPQSDMESQTAKDSTEPQSATISVQPQDDESNPEPQSAEDNTVPQDAESNPEPQSAKDNAEPLPATKHGLALLSGEQTSRHGSSPTEVREGSNRRQAGQVLNEDRTGNTAEGEQELPTKDTTVESQPNTPRSAHAAEALSPPPYSQTVAESSLQFPSVAEGVEQSVEQSGRSQDDTYSQTHHVTGSDTAHGNRTKTDQETTSEIGDRCHARADIPPRSRPQTVGSWVKVN